MRIIIFFFYFLPIIFPWNSLLYWPTIKKIKNVYHQRMCYPPNHVTTQYNEVTNGFVHAHWTRTYATE